MRSYFLVLAVVLAVGLQGGEVAALGGVFELKLKSFTNNANRDVDGLCCSLNETFCRTKCSYKFRICVKNYQVTIDPSGDCYFGESVVVLDQKIVHFPFNFRWPGTFSLIIEALQPTNGKSYLLRKRKHVIHPLPLFYQGTDRLVSRMAIQQYLDIGETWKKREWVGQGEVQMNVEYRVRCLPDYYGEACDKTCRARDDKFGHYECSEFGDRVCREGWEGEYCERALCTPGCSPTHGNCTTPNTCTCHLGWEGPLCTECTLYPGCKHGRCSKQFECECDEGWGGLFCNQDLNYCTNHNPCLNGGTCFNTGQGSYTCNCPEGFEGSDCEWRKGEVHCGKCENGGVCRDSNNSKKFCACSEGFTGPTCSTPTCTTKCLNNGTCLDNKSCACPPTYGGPTCAIKLTQINICQANPCANGATCIPLNDSNYTCTCKSGFYGSDCSEKCDNCTAEELKEEELSTQHVVGVVTASIVVPVLLVVAAIVVRALKQRKEAERARNDELVRQQNEQNHIQCLKKCGKFVVNDIERPRGKWSNLEKVCSINISSPNLLSDPYNPPPPKLNNTNTTPQSSPVIFSLNKEYATEV